MAKAEQAAKAKTKKKPATKKEPKITQGIVIDPAALRGVSMDPSRPYHAGLVIARHGLAAGVTDAMVAELDTAYGRPCPRESLFALRNAWHACRAFAEAANATK